jgi:excisionase family DNA binding protein
VTRTQTPAHKRYVSPAEAASELGVSKSTIYRAVEAGRLPAVRLQPLGALRIPVAVLKPERQEQ